MSNIETKQTITFDEFRAWLTGLIRGMDGQLPGTEEWKLIKQMMDKVVPDVERVEGPSYPPFAPMPADPHPRRPDDSGELWPERWPYRIWCNDRTENNNDIRFTHTNGDVNSPSFTTNGHTSEQLNLAIDHMIQNNST